MAVVEAKKVVFTGSRGAGKTTGLARFPRPSEMSEVLYVDTEGSAVDIVEENERLGYPFGTYLPAHERFPLDMDVLDVIAGGVAPWAQGGKKVRAALTDYWNWFINALNKRLEQGRFKYVCIDTVEPVEAAMAAWAESNPGKSGWSGVKAYGRFEVEAVRPLYEAVFTGCARRGVEWILLASHIKQLWENEQPVVNKVRPGGRLVPLSRLSTFMFWLFPDVGNSDGAPAAVVLKGRKAHTEVRDDDWVIRKALPPRIPHYTRADLERYWSTGVDFSALAPEEQLTDFERDVISPFLTNIQMRLMVLGAEEDARQDAQRRAMQAEEAARLEAALTEPLADRVKRLANEGQDIAAIAAEVGKPVPVVKAMLSER